MWRDHILGEKTRIDIGGTPSRDRDDFWAEKPNGFPWVAISDLKAKYLTDTAEYIAQAGVSSSNVKLVPAGTLLMSFKLSIGRAAIPAMDVFTNEAIAAFYPDESVIRSRFLYHALPTAALCAITDTAIKGATLNKQKLRLLTITAPESNAQEDIAEILDTTDELIEKTEALITKYEQIKRGMMQDLFTRGLDEAGRLRPPPEDTPDLYHETELGCQSAFKTDPLSASKIDPSFWFFRRRDSRRRRAGFRAGGGACGRIGWMIKAVEAGEAGDNSGQAASRFLKRHDAFPVSTMSQ